MTEQEQFQTFKEVYNNKRREYFKFYRTVLFGFAIFICYFFLIHSTIEDERKSVLLIFTVFVFGIYTLYKKHKRKCELDLEMKELVREYKQRRENIKS